MSKRGRNRKTDQPCFCFFFFFKDLPLEYVYTKNGNYLKKKGETSRKSIKERCKSRNLNARSEDTTMNKMAKEKKTGKKKMGN